VRIWTTRIAGCRKIARWLGAELRRMLGRWIPVPGSGTPCAGVSNSSFCLRPSDFPLDSLVVAFSRELAHLETSPLELLGFVATLLNVWLMARNKVAGWPVGLVAVAAYSVVNFDVKLYADMLLQGFFFVTGVAGWYDWKFGGEQRTELPISRLSRRGWALTAVAVVATPMPPTRSSTPRSRARRWWGNCCSFAACLTTG